MSASVSVIVPTRSRPVHLARLLDLLAEQRLPTGCTLETNLAVDGDDAAAVTDVAAGSGLPVKVVSPGRVGISAAKNTAIAEARGDILLLLNDDVEPVADFVAEHVAAQLQGHAVVLGHAPWKRRDNTTLLDACIERTRMIFFYDGLQPGGSYDFRHAWNLNLSIHRSRLEGIEGPFAAELRPCMYEDIELAYRLMGDDAGVYFHPAACAVHDHRYTFAGYLRREAMLGVIAPQLSCINPACFERIFGADLDSLTQAARDAINVDVPDESRAAHALMNAAQASCDESTCDTEVELFYTAHLPLKRRAFRCGLLAAANAPDAAWQDRWDLAGSALAGDPVLGRLFQNAERVMNGEPVTANMGP